MTVSEEVALAQAARTAGLAPSIHNSQPWRWRVDGAQLDLRAERSRQLAVTDPEGRMLAISCGAALHHVRLALAAEGWAVTVTRLPDHNDQDLLARLSMTGRTNVTPAAMRLLQTARIRHTDRRPLTDTPVEPAVIDALRAACVDEGTRMHVLSPDAVVGWLPRRCGRSTSRSSIHPGATSWFTGLAVRATAASASPPRPSPALSQPLPCPAAISVPWAICPWDRVTTPLRYTRSSTATRTPQWPGCVRARHSVRSGSSPSSTTWRSSRSAPRSRSSRPGSHCAGCSPMSANHSWRFVEACADPDYPGPPHTPRRPADQVVEIVKH